jgi:hypothetical protein
MTDELDYDESDANADDNEMTDAAFVRVAPRQFLSMPDRVPNGEPINDAIAAMQAKQKERIVLAEFTESDEPEIKEHEVFGPFADADAALAWIESIESLFNTPEGRAAHFTIMKLDAPFTA